MTCPGCSVYIELYGFRFRMTLDEAGFESILIVSLGLGNYLNLKEEFELEHNGKLKLFSSLVNLFITGSPKNMLLGRHYKSLILGVVLIFEEAFKKCKNH